MTAASEAIARLVRPIEDWPVDGVTFRDITPLLGDPAGFSAVVEELATIVTGLGQVDAVVGIEARGFILGAPLALRTQTAFVPVRKSGKLPAETLSTSYDLEYGSETVEVHVDAITPGSRVVLVDDVLATGGTLEAAHDLVEQAGATVVGQLVMIEIAALEGRARLGETPLTVLHTY